MMDWEKACKDIKAMNWIILLILGVAGFYLMSPAFTLGIILGGLIIIINFNVLQRTIRNSFGPDGVLSVKGNTIVVKYYFRLAILGIIIYILVTHDWVDPVGFTVGLSTIVLSIFYFGIRLIWKKSSEETI
jgi:hypothetical protein